MRPTKQEILALILAALPFIIHFQDRSVATIDGETTVLYSYDYAAVLLGAISLFVVVLAFVATRDHFRSEYPVRDDLRGQSAGFHYAVLAAIALLAVYQVLRGAALI